ncbi:MAG: RNA polymerase factor sigma-54, partial [Sandaracinobacteroides sp.]
MGLGPRLDLRTSQTLVISPQLQAAIKLLTLSNLELVAEISAELERNPLLEMAEDADGAGDGQPDGEPEPAQAADNDPRDMDAELSADDGGARTEDQDIDYVEERFHHDSIADSGRPAEPGEDFSFDQVAADELTLGEHLERQ